MAETVGIGVAGVGDATVGGKVCFNRFAGGCVDAEGVVGAG